MVSKQTGEILKLRLLMDRRLTSSQISRYFPGKHPFAFRKLTEQAGKSDSAYLAGFLKNVQKPIMRGRPEKCRPAFHWKCFLIIYSLRAQIFAFLFSLNNGNT